MTKLRSGALMKSQAQGNAGETASALEREGDRRCLRRGQYSMEWLKHFQDKIMSRSNQDYLSIEWGKEE